MKAETRGMTDPDEYGPSGRKSKEENLVGKGMMVAKETLSVVTRHATREEMPCSLENYNIGPNSRPSR
jgi:hypothetical protein